MGIGLLGERGVRTGGRQAWEAGGGENWRLCECVREEAVTLISVSKSGSQRFSFMCKK